jgi:hypothetical protein
MRSSYAGQYSIRLNFAPASSRAADSNGWRDSDICAVLVLDAGGKIVAANESASQLWGRGTKMLVGSDFAALFSFVVAFCGSDEFEGDWKDLRNAALDRWAMLMARPTGDAPCEVRVRLEHSVGGAGTYIATIQKVFAGAKS